MIKETEIKTRDKNFSLRDPRIDSADVKVIYPTPIDQESAEQLLQHKAAEERMESQVEPAPEKKEEHQCKVDLQEAIKQNILGFAALVIFSLGVGYLIGKK